MAKKIDLDLAYEFLGKEPSTTASEKKTINAEKKKIKELRVNHPINIAVSFKIPWWDVTSEAE